MKKVLFPIMALILVVCLVPLIAAPAAATWTGNLLQNPGAETGDMTGWTPDPGIAAIPSLAESCGTVLPNSDSYFFTMGPDGTAGVVSMEQEIDLTTLGGTPVSFEAGGWVQTEKYWEPGWPSTGDPGIYDHGALSVEFFNSGGGSLGEFLLHPVENPCCEQCGIPLAYAEFSLTDAVPTGAATAVYRVEGHHAQSIYINTFYDDLYFMVDVAPACTDADEDGYSIEGGQCGPIDCDDSDLDIHPGATEVCDSKDNDCDAGTQDGSDEAWYLQPTSCGVGECAAAGQWICQNGVQVDTCTPGTPTAEICDGKDNDCDGEVDEGGVCGPVGGTILPTDKSGLAMPWIVAAALIVVAGVSLAIWHRKRGAEKASDR